MPSLLLKCITVMVFLWVVTSPVLAYAHPLDGSETSHHQPVEGTGHQDKSTTCDHCCHYSAHAVGMLSRDAAAGAIADGKTPPMPYNRYVFLTSPPPSPPPIPG